MRVAREEIFGPVLSVIRVPDNAAAFEAANAVEYGLAASVYTRDVRAIFQFVDKVDVGIAHVNQPTLGGEVHLPFGGVKASGIGPHEQGREADRLLHQGEDRLHQLRVGAIRPTCIAITAIAPGWTSAAPLPT